MHADRTNRVALTVFGVLVLARRHPGGTTIMQPTALTGALTREISAYHGVDAAGGRIIGDPKAPEIVVAVTASQTTDLHELHQRIETEALAHARQARPRQDRPGDQASPWRQPPDRLIGTHRAASKAATGPATSTGPSRSWWPSDRAHWVVPPGQHSASGGFRGGVPPG